MRLSPAVEGAGRHLHVVPDRAIPRAPYAPAGRRLALLDLENLVGGSHGDLTEVTRCLDLVIMRAGLARSDHVEVGMGPSLAAATAGAIPPYMAVRVGSGLDGGERSLLERHADAVWIAARYDEVVIGSGDHLFEPLAVALRELGIPCVVVARCGSLATGLRRAASSARTLVDIGESREAA